MNDKPKGFALILVLAAITLIGVQLIVLTAGSRDMLTNANRTSITACQRNLAASALAWTQLHQNDPAINANATIELDPNQVKSPSRHSSIRIKRTPAGFAVHTSCTLGTFNSNKEFTTK